MSGPETFLSTTQVFTPETSAQHTFIERNPYLSRRIFEAFFTPGKQVLLYGESGCGKTTLCRRSLERYCDHHIETECLPGQTFEQLIEQAFDRLNTYFMREVKRSTGWKRSGRVPKFFDLSRSSTLEEISVRATGVPFTPQRLAQDLNEKNCWWVIENIQNLAPAERSSLFGAMQAFKSITQDDPGVKMVVVGTAATPDEFLSYAPRDTGLSLSRIPPMADSEIIQIIELGQRLLNVKFARGVQESLLGYSNGSAKVCHQICLNMCLGRDIFETCDEQYVMTNVDLSQAVVSFEKQQESIIDRQQVLLGAQQKLLLAVRDQRQKERRVSDRRRKGASVLFAGQNRREAERRGLQRREKERRVAERYAIIAPVSYEFNHSVLKGQLCDISESGLSIAAPHPCERDTRIKIRLRDTVRSTTISRTARVLRCDRTTTAASEHQSMWILGLKFAQKLPDNPCRFYPYSAPS